MPEPLTPDRMIRRRGLPELFGYLAVHDVTSLHPLE